MRTGRVWIAAAAFAGALGAIAGCSAILGINDLVPPDVNGPGDSSVLDDRTTAMDGMDAGDADVADREVGDEDGAPGPIEPVMCSGPPCTPTNICDKGASCESSCADLDAADPTANGVSCGTDADVVCATGACLSAEWAEWPMPNYVQGMTDIPNTKNYTANGDGTVTDNVTGLMWQQMVSVSTTDAGPVQNMYTWDAAAQYCANLSLGGQGGWRMPTMIELISIVDYNQATPAIDSSIFPGTPSDFFWVSTLLPGSSSSAGVISLDNGGEGVADVSSMRYVRCVR